MPGTALQFLLVTRMFIHATLTHYGDQNLYLAQLAWLLLHQSIYNVIEHFLVLIPDDLTETRVLVFYLLQEHSHKPFMI